MNLNASTRTYIYAIAVALLPILVGYGLLTPDKAPLWLALAAALLSIAPPALAIRHVTPDPVTPTSADEDEPAQDLPDGGLTDLVDTDD